LYLTGSVDPYKKLWVLNYQLWIMNDELWMCYLWVD
jgi:hypothetical protein